MERTRGWSHRLAAALYGTQRSSFDLAIAHKANQHFASDPLGAEQPDEIISPGDCDVVERQKHVALLQACQCRRATRLRCADAHCTRACPERQRHAPGQRHSLRRDSDVRAAHASVADDLADDENRRGRCPAPS